MVKSQKKVGSITTKRDIDVNIKHERFEEASRQNKNEQRASESEGMRRKIIFKGTSHFRDDDEMKGKILVQHENVYFVCISFMLIK
jgi:hypothetical protein